MNRLNNTAPVAGQDKLDLKPLSNKLGHNGPYIGAGAPIERDCDRISGHTDLFRDPERFIARLDKLNRTAHSRDIPGHDG